MAGSSAGNARLGKCGGPIPGRCFWFFSFFSFPPYFIRFLISLLFPLPSFLCLPFLCPFRCLPFFCLLFICPFLSLPFFVSYLSVLFFVFLSSSHIFLSFPLPSFLRLLFFCPFLCLRIFVSYSSVLSFAFLCPFSFLQRLLVCALLFA